MKTIRLFLAAAIIMLASCNPKVDRIIYVDADASPGGDGRSWGSAYADLQKALKDAGKGDELWVAEGIYHPDGSRGDRKKSFQLKTGVAVYGGFSGSETERDERNWVSNVTILSGDLLENDQGNTNIQENSYHVLTGDKTDNTAILDGFLVTGGNANDTIWPNDGGGGMSNADGSPTVRNCTFTKNHAFADGGGIRNWGESTPRITDCIFRDNRAAQEGGGIMNGPDSRANITNCQFIHNFAGEDGGGMYNNESHPLVVNCIFYRNSAALTGGGMYNVNESKPAVVNCSFHANQAETEGGGIYNNTGIPILTNCILWGNQAPEKPEISGTDPVVTYSNIQGDFPGEGNMRIDPDFADDQLRLSAGSTCIDAGDNAAVPEHVTTDLDHHPRITNGRVDMGAFEYGSGPG